MLYVLLMISDLSCVLYVFFGEVDFFLIFVFLSVLSMLVRVDWLVSVGV